MAGVGAAGGRAIFAARPTCCPIPFESYAGSVLCLAQTAEPDTEAFDAPEIVVRLKKHHHAGLIVRSESRNACSNYWRNTARSSRGGFWPRCRRWTGLRPREFGRKGGAGGCAAFAALIKLSPFL